jgi:hypothetical protein
LRCGPWGERSRSYASCPLHLPHLVGGLVARRETGTSRWSEPGSGPRSAIRSLIAGHRPS